MREHGVALDFIGKVFVNCSKLKTDGKTFCIDDFRYIILFICCLHYRRVAKGEPGGMGSIFEIFPNARHATDVTFQQLNRPVGNMQERRKLSSDKNKFCGLKFDVSIISTGFAI